ncbi:MAG: NFACT RNA binding domain-containing protein [Natronincolaceae bacterium]|jgi:predicted ribosome quality control (RQC) complex YloA/Tae2 family protein|nr:NFACT RNA binding domain-containing protein [Bacillota bacterium]NLK91079.1 fibronectin/fibrinogen-binding protein [Clostridiales bacterium]
MALDGFVIAALTHELKSRLCAGRIDKIHQPEADEIVVVIRNNGKNYKVLLSANSNYPKIHFTKLDKKNPINPPNFCMVLRKHLLGGRVVDIRQPQFERIIELVIEFLDELNILKTKKLLIEMMGRHSNIILVDCEDNKIIDSIKRIPSSVSRYRQVLPGLEYVMPPSQNKINPLEIDTKNDFISAIQNKDKRTSIYKAIYTSFTGISPLLSRETCYRSSIDENTILFNLDNQAMNDIYGNFMCIIDKIKTNSFTPTIYYDNITEKYIDFSSISISHLDYYEKLLFESTNDMLESFYLKRDSKERIKQRTNDLRKNIRTKLDRMYNKLNNLNEDLKKGHNAEKYRLYGNLITANIYQIEKNQDTARLVNYYDKDHNTITIPLKKELTPAQNAQKYFKMYNKAKTAISEISNQIKKTRRDIDYLEQIMINIEQCTHMSDIEEIRTELEENKILKRKITKKGAKLDKRSNYLKYISSEGFEIFVGKNNKQNNDITFKMASKEDLWFHIKDMPGSHVVLRQGNKTPGDLSILEAAALAAYYSKARNSTKVAVDYTQRKNVKKQHGAKPGMVIYDNYSTVLVDSDERSVFKNIREESICQ